MNHLPERTQRIVGYLAIDLQISEKDAEIVKQIQILLLEGNVSLLAKQKLIAQLVTEVTKSMESLHCKQP